MAPDNAEEMPIDDAYSMIHGESTKLSEQACKEVKELNTDMEYRNLVSKMKKKKGIFLYFNLLYTMNNASY